MFMLILQLVLCVFDAEIDEDYTDKHEGDNGQQQGNKAVFVGLKRL